MTTTLEAYVYDFLERIDQQTEYGGQQYLPETIENLTRTITQSKNWLTPTDPKRAMLRAIRDGLRRYQK